MRHILFIDGRNFLGNLDAVLNPDKDPNKKVDYAKYDFAGLFAKVLAGVPVDQRRFYLGRLLVHPDTKKKSEELIEQQRQLKNSLEQQGFVVILTGRVRAHMEIDGRGKEVRTFKEKGVDVQIAVDMVLEACRKNLATAIIASSDSDLQPAIGALRSLRVARTYVGFEKTKNKGIAYTTDSTILIRNLEVVECLQQPSLLAKAA